MLSQIFEQIRINQQMFQNLNSVLKSNWDDRKFEDFFKRRASWLYSFSPFTGMIFGHNQSLNNSKHRIEDMLNQADSLLSEIEKNNN